MSLWSDQLHITVVLDMEPDPNAIRSGTFQGNMADTAVVAATIAQAIEYALEPFPWTLRPSSLRLELARTM